MNSKKTFFDNEPTINLQDKWLVLTAGNNNDFKASYNSLIEELKRDLLRPYLEKQVGSLVINMDNATRGVKKFDDGYLEYLLCDNTEYFLEDYPLLKGKVLTFNDANGRVKFKSFDFINRTLKGSVSSVALGTTEEDAMQNHTHSNTHTHGTNPHSHYMGHNHDMSHEHDYSVITRFGRVAGGSYWNVADGQGNARTWGGRTTTGWSRDWVDNTTVAVQNSTIVTDTGSGRKADETRMKNVAVNMYLVAGVMIKGV
jgi:hypothetical protein